MSPARRGGPSRPSGGGGRPQRPAGRGQGSPGRSPGGKAQGAPGARGGPARGQAGRGQAGRGQAGRGQAGRGQAGRGQAGRGQGREDRSPGAVKPRSAPRGVGGEQVEGRQAVRELLLAGARRVRELWVATDIDDPTGIVDDIVDLAADLRVLVQRVSRAKLEAEARSEAPQGVLAKAAPLPEHDLDELAARRDAAGRAPFLLALDGVTDPGNLGALLRSAECAGVTGVVLPRHRSVHVTPTVAKAAAGAVEYLPVALVGGLPNALARLREMGVWVVGLDAGGERALDDLDAAATGPVCVVLGAEGRGLGRLTRDRCDTIVAIALRGRLASLNVSAAGAVAMYEIARRRP